MTALRQAVSIEDVLVGLILPVLDPTKIRLVTNLRDVVMPDAGPTQPDVLELYKVTSTESTPTLEQSTVDVDYYARTRLEASDGCHAIQWLMLHDLVGATAASGTILKVSLLAGAAERPYINDNVYRFGLSCLVTLHGHLS